MRSTRTAPPALREDPPPEVGRAMRRAIDPIEPPSRRGEQRRRSRSLYAAGARACRRRARPGSGSEREVRCPWVCGDRGSFRMHRGIPAGPPSLPVHPRRHASRPAPTTRAAQGHPGGHPSCATLSPFPSAAGGPAMVPSPHRSPDAPARRIRSPPKNRPATVRLRARSLVPDVHGRSDHPAA